MSTKETSTNTIKISMIEDIKDIRENVTKYVNFHEEFEVVDVFDSVESFCRHVQSNPSFEFDIMLLDVGLPGVTGIEGIPLILENYPNTDIMMLTTYEEEDVILQAICAGATSYVSKKSSLTEIVAAIRIVANGGSYMSPSIAREIVQHLIRGKSPKENSLTERQNEIIKFLSEGKTYKEISEALFISIETVRTHVKKLYRHLHVNNKTEAIALYLQGKIK